MTGFAKRDLTAHFVKIEIIIIIEFIDRALGCIVPEYIPTVHVLTNLYS